MWHDDYILCIHMYIRYYIQQEQDPTPSPAPGHSVISATVICHWSFPTERHQSWSLTLCAACHPSATRSFVLGSARASTIMRRHVVIMCSVFVYVYLRSQWRHGQTKNSGDGGPGLCFHTRFRSHVSHYHGGIIPIYLYIPGAVYAVQVTGCARWSILYIQIVLARLRALVFGLQKSDVSVAKRLFQYRRIIITAVVGNRKKYNNTFSVSYWRGYTLAAGPPPTTKNAPAKHYIISDYVCVCVRVCACVCFQWVSPRTRPSVSALSDYIRVSDGSNPPIVFYKCPQIYSAW